MNGRSPMGRYSLRSSTGCPSIRQRGFLMKASPGAVLMLLGTLVLNSATSFGFPTRRCVTGTDPSVVGDIQQLAAVRAHIQSLCPCSSFDGTAGRTHKDYIRC